MATTHFKGNENQTNGSLPQVGQKAPDFSLVASDLSEKSLADFAGKNVVLTVNPSYDTGVCQATARRFNSSLGERGDVVVLAISADLPFAQKRFCEADGLDHVVPLSSFRASFAKDYGLELVNGPLKGLTARAVIVVGKDGLVKSSELVPEITTEPDYAKAQAALG
ncbi:MAG TPA: thiol peroxidase [Polyangiaceae bacterium]|nr:thiol peroxidase [Polyangiaceae bacterium]